MVYIYNHEDNYVIFTEVKFNPKLPVNDYILSSYGEDEVNFQLLGYDVLNLKELKSREQERKSPMELYFE